MIKPVTCWLQPASILLRNSLILCVVMLSAACKPTQDKFTWKVREVNVRTAIVSTDSLLRIEGTASDRKYGFDPNKPIMLGMKDRSYALSYIEKYLNTLTGPKGEEIWYRRVRSCCPYKTVNSGDYFEFVAVLEVYELQYAGLHVPLTVYFNFFDEGPVLAPRGLGYKKF
jgi:hypothetical protein